ncbi:hypothetical protein FKM82_023706 [Ascaphus truei]
MSALRVSLLNIQLPQDHYAPEEAVCSTAKRVETNSETRLQPLILWTTLFSFPFSNPLGIHDRALSWISSNLASYFVSHFPTPPPQSISFGHIPCSLFYAVGDLITYLGFKYHLYTDDTNLPLNP